MCLYMHIQRDESLLSTMLTKEHLPESLVAAAFCSLSCFLLWQNLFLREISKHQQNVFLVR